MQMEKEKERAVKGGGCGLENIERKTCFIKKHWYCTQVSILAYIIEMNFTKEPAVRAEGSQDSKQAET